MGCRRALCETAHAVRPHAALLRHARAAQRVEIGPSPCCRQKQPDAGRGVLPRAGILPPLETSRARPLPAATSPRQMASFATLVPDSDASTISPPWVST
jgi:hypothetical protein